MTHLKRTILLVLLGMACTSSSMSQSQQSSCDLKDGYAADYIASLGVSAMQAERTITVLKEFESFADSRPWKPNIPMGQQMNTEEAVKFGELRQKQSAQMLLGLHYSKRERDINAIYQMAVIADKTARYGFEQPKDENSHEAVLAAIVFATREAVNIDSAEVSKMIHAAVQVPCSLEAALLQSAKVALNQLAEIRWEEASARLKMLSKKYGEKLDVSKLTTIEQESYRSDSAVISKVQEQYNLVYDMLRLVRIEQTSKTMLASWLQDHSAAPGDIKYVGTTLRSWKDSDKIDDVTFRATGVLNFLNQKIPAELINDLGSLTKQQQ